MKILPIEINYWEDRDLGDRGESFKRSEQFRMLSHKINELIREHNEPSTLEYLVRYYKGWDKVI